MRSLSILTVLVLAVACVPTAAPSPAPSSSATAARPLPTASTSPAPLPTPTGAPIPLPTNARIAAAGNGVVWVLVADTRLFRSTDSGQTWTERGLPSPMTAPFVSGLAFVNASEGWILIAGSPATQCQSQSASIFHTSDGAATWQRLDATGIAEAGCKGAFAFNDAKRGYVSTWSPNGAPVVYRTADGGLTWTAGKPLPDPPGFTTQPGGTSLQTGPVADFGAVLFVGAYGQASGTMQGYAYRSTDGGATWSFAGTAPRSEVGITFVTASRWFEIILPGPSAETTDGGSTWHPYTTDYQQAAPVAPQIVFGDANTGYATVRGGLQRTADGGAHWTSIKTPGTLSP